MDYGGPLAGVGELGEVTTSPIHFMGIPRRDRRFHWFVVSIVLGAIQEQHIHNHGTANVACILRILLYIYDSALHHVIIHHV